MSDMTQPEWSIYLDSHTSLTNTGLPITNLNKMHSGYTPMMGLSNLIKTINGYMPIVQ